MAGALAFRKFAGMGAILAVLSSAVVAEQSENCERRTVVVNVRDRNGTLAMAVPPTSFHAKLHGESVKIQSANVDAGPRRVLLLVDLSGSVAGTANTWKIARLAASDFLKTSSANRIALMTFSDQVWDSLDFSASPTLILQKLEQLGNERSATPKGHQRTAFFDAVIRATSVFGIPQSGDVIYALTDGGDNNSRAQLEDAEKALLTQGIRFFAFYVAETHNLTEEDRLGPPNLSALAEASGGTVVDVPNQTLSGQYDLSSKGWARITEQLHELYDLMAQFYRVEIELPARIHKKQNWELEVVDGKGKRSKYLYVIYPHRLAPCRTQAPTQ